MFAPMDNILSPSISFCPLTGQSEPSEPNQKCCLTEIYASSSSFFNPFKRRWAKSNQDADSNSWSLRGIVRSWWNTGPTWLKAVTAPERLQDHQPCVFFPPRSIKYRDLVMSLGDNNSHPRAMADFLFRCWVCIPKVSREAGDSSVINERFHQASEEAGLSWLKLPN